MNPEKELTEYVQTWDANQTTHPVWQDYKQDFESYFSKFKTSRESQEFTNLTFFPCLADKTSSTPFDKSYYYQDTWASSKIFQRRPESLLDIGSTLLYSGIISQFVPTTFVDIRPVQVDLPGLTVVDGSILELPFEDYSQNFITSLCVVEHIGLGRYGDPIMPDGARRACAEINRVLKPGGEIVLSVPVGIPCIAYNAHRIFSREQLLSYFPGYTVLDEVFLTPEPAGSEVLANLKEPGQYVVWVVHLGKAQNAEIANWLAHNKPIPTPHFVKEEAVRYYAEKYALNTLVETGTYLGDMIFAMKDIFKKIVSIELSSELYLQARSKFWEMSNVELIQGDSGKVFQAILPQIEEPCLFWLDGHYSAGITAKGQLETPIREELQAIFTHPQKENYIILIDDARCFTGENDYPKLTELKELVAKNLPNHVWEVKDDIIRIYLPLFQKPQVQTGLPLKDQIDNFNKLSQAFEAKYNLLKKHPLNPKLILPYWEEQNEKLEESILPVPPISFLGNQVILETMFVGYDRFYKHQIAYLEKQIPPEQILFLLKEDCIGTPPVTTKYGGIETSYNTVHHLHHIAKFVEHTNCKLTDIKSVVEWGGGYGNLAKIFKKMKQGEELTYTIIDTPIFSVIQWLYLGSILGETNVNLINEPNQSIAAGKINLLPLNFLDNCLINNVDLFISTWALSECSDFAQDYILTHQWFNAKHFLLAYHLAVGDAFPFASRVGEIAASGGATTVDIDFLPGNQYAFR